MGRDPRDRLHSDGAHLHLNRLCGVWPVSLPNQPDSSFAQSRSRLFDSPPANSYTIYLLHYAFVSWLQYALLPASLPAVAKAVIVFLGALGFSWPLAATIRRVPAVARLV